MSWTFIYMMVFLKLPIAGLLWLVWWAVHQNDEETAGATDDDGGSKIRPRPHPRRPLPRPPRRGPHGSPPPPSPARMRSVLARAGKVEQ